MRAAHGNSWGNSAANGNSTESCLPGTTLTLLLRCLWTAHPSPKLMCVSSLSLTYRFPEMPLSPSISYTFSSLYLQHLLLIQLHSWSLKNMVGSLPEKKKSNHPLTWPLLHSTSCLIPSFWKEPLDFHSFHWFLKPQPSLQPKEKPALALHCQNCISLPSPHLMQKPLFQMITMTF